MPTLGDFVALQRGTTYQSRLLGEEGPILLGLATIGRNGGFRDDSLRRYAGECNQRIMVDSGDLYVSLKDVTQAGDLLGAVARFPSGIGAGRLTQDTVKLVQRDPRIDWAYLYWLLRTPQYRDYCRSHATGTTNLGLSREDFLAYSVPDYTSQRGTLVDTLDIIESKIELNRRISATLEAMARAVFKSWFVDFDPVRAKAEGRDPGLPAEIAALFPYSFESNAIPLGWATTSVYEVADVIFGAPFASGSFNSDRAGKPLIRIRDLKEQSPNIYTTEEHPRGYLAQPGDLLVGMDGEFRPYMWSGVEAWMNQRICCFRPKQGVSRAYVHYAIEDLLLEVERSEAATTVIHLGKSDIDQFRVVDPPRDLMRSYTDVADILERRLLAASQESRTLVALRDALLPKVISGELRVTDAERVLDKSA